MTTRDEISGWFDRGVAQGASHLIVVCDTYDHEDYPVFADSDEDALRQYAAHNGQNMQRVMEVYDLRQDKLEQLSAHRVFRLPATPGA